MQVRHEDDIEKIRELEAKCMNLIYLNSLLRDRHDLPIERLRAYTWVEARLKQFAKCQSVMKEVASMSGERWLEAQCKLAKELQDIEGG